MNKTKKAENFFNWFRERYRFIKCYCTGKIEGYILACAYLDSLAVYRYGRKSRRGNFGKFLKRYAGKSNIYELISLPLLRYKLEESPNRYNNTITVFENALGVIESDFRKMGHNVDVSLCGLESKLKGNLNQQMLRDVLKIAPDFEYATILYRDYRCNLIHQSKLPISDLWGEGNEKEPFYFSEWGPPQGQSSKIRFKIPQVFILDSLNSCINNFETDYKKNPTKPLSEYLSNKT